MVNQILYRVHQLGSHVVERNRVVRAAIHPLKPHSHKPPLTPTLPYILDVVVDIPPVPVVRIPLAPRAHVFLRNEREEPPAAVFVPRVPRSHPQLLHAPTNINSHLNPNFKLSVNPAVL